MYSHRKELTLDAEPSTQDGSNSSSGELHSSETRRNKTKQWKYQVVLMLKTETSTCLTSMEELNNNGTSSMPRTGRVNQPRDNGIETGASRSIPISISFPDLERVDILITFQEEILLSRLKMVDQAKNGTSINLQELSEVDQSTNQLIFTTLVKEITCNTTALAPTGGRCSSTKVNTLSISIPRK